MSISVYLLLNEDTHIHNSLITKSSKPKREDSNPPRMLQRHRVESISIFTFESSESGQSYKINEEELDNFANQVKILKDKQSLKN
jgi:hypothetical protein